MAAVKRKPSTEVTPRFLRRERAAGYLDVSPSKFDALVKAGIVPPPKKIDVFVKAWDRRDLDACADSLPYDGAVFKSGKGA